MLAAERIQKIRHILLEYKKADVSYLSNLLNVSDVTIRKDMERLEKENFLTRTHGGAILNEYIAGEHPSNLFEIPEIEHKRMIGLIAAQMVRDKEAIFIGSGTTCLQIAKNLKEKRRLTVVTNNISVGIELANISGINVRLTGGNVVANEFTYSLIGPATEDSIKNIYVDRAFIGVGGISLERGVTMNDANEVSIASGIIKNTKEIIVVADNTKFDKIAFSCLGDINVANKVISDELTPQKYIKYFFENNIQIFTTYDLD